MYLRRTAHLGEVIVSVWPRELKGICSRHNLHVLEWNTNAASAR